MYPQITEIQFISESQLSISQFLSGSARAQIGNWQLAIGNELNLRMIFSRSLRAFVRAVSRLTTCTALFLSHSDSTTHPSVHSSKWSEELNCSQRMSARFHASTSRQRLRVLMAIAFRFVVRTLQDTEYGDSIRVDLLSCKGGRFQVLHRE